MVEKVNGGDSGRKGEFTIVVFKTKVYIVYGWFGEEDEGNFCQKSIIFNGVRN